MSKIRNNKFILTLVILFVSLFFWGCNKSSVKVDKIYFNFESGEHIALMVGEELDLSNYVVVVPSIATNKEYSVSSLNEQVVSVEGKTIKAMKAGYAIIKVVANENQVKESSILVVVKEEKESLVEPQNLRYVEETQSIEFDRVDFASSYTLRIDGEEINIGNFTSYSLKNSQKQKLDQVQVIQVKANAAEYSQAFESSGFTREYKIYQSSAVQGFKIENGFGAFEIPANSKNNVKVLINGNVLVENLTTNTFALNNLDSKYCGSEVKISVVSSLNSQDKAQMNADYYASGIVSIDSVKVLNVNEFSLVGNNLEWTKDSEISKFELLVNSKKVADCSTNSYNLSNLSGFENMFSNSTVVEVKPVIEGSVNVAKTNATSKINIKKLNKPQATINRSLVNWTTVEGANGYVVKIINTETNVSLSAQVLSNSLDMANYVAGSYKVEIYAISDGVKKQDGICYLPSNAESITFEKYETISAKISDDRLIIDDSENGASYYVEFENSENNFTTNEKIVSLNGKVFDAGVNTVKITKLGGADNLDSDIFEFSFIQLEDVETASISDMVLNVEKSELNNEAIILLEVCLINGATETRQFVQEGIEIDFKEKSLAAGKYVVNIYVKANQDNVLSVKDLNGKFKVTKKVEFEVLDCPTVSIQDTSKTVISLNGVQNVGSYRIVGVDGEELKNDTTTQHSFEFAENENEFKFYVQAIGDGSTCFDSVVSEEITVTKLEKPTLSYSSENGIISKESNNDDSVVGSYVFKVNGEQVDYDFNSVYQFNENLDIFELSLSAIAKAGSANQFYLDSDVFEKTLTRISNESSIAIDGVNNNLVISPVGHDREFDICVEVKCNNEVYALSSVGKTGVLSNGEISLNYAYESNKYVISLLNEDGHQPIIVDMADNGFTVKVKYINKSTSDELIDGTFSEESNELNLIRVENATEMLLNDSGELEIYNPSYTDKLNLKLTISVDSSLYVFETNGTKLVCENLELPYRFNNEKYYVKLLNSNFEPIISEMDSNFSVVVQYCVNENGHWADSDVSETFEFGVETETSLTREGQTLIINKENQTYRASNYKLLIENEVYQFENPKTNADGNIVIDVEQIFEQISNKTEATEIRVLTIGNKNNTLVKAGEVIKIKQAEVPSMVISSSKDNNSSENYAKLTLTTIDEGHTYIIECYEEDVLKTTKEYSYSIAPYVFNIDNETLNMSGTISFVVRIETGTKNGDVEVFNSVRSTISYKKLEKVKNIILDNNVLKFSEVAGAVGYEIYANGEKLNSNLITETEYDLSSIVEETIITVKAISDVQNDRRELLTNSDVSDEIIVTKLSNPTVEFENGVAKITFDYILDMELPILLTNGKATVRITKNDGEVVNISLDSLQEGISIQNATFSTIVTVQPYVFLTYSYNSESILEEELNLQIIANNGSSDYRLNSDVVTFELLGLSAPINVGKTTTAGNDGVDMIAWDKNPLNVIDGEEIVEKYIVKFIKDGTEYYSNDPKLKYEENGHYYSYDEYITGTSIPFPAVYEIEEGSGLVFDNGEFEVYVQAIPASMIDDKIICSSKYSDQCEFKLMQLEGLSISEGIISWKSNSKALEYDVEIIYNDKGEEKTLTATTDDNKFNIDSTEITGVCLVRVKAISKSPEYLNSQFEEIYAYRLDAPAEIRIEDGNLILVASDCFTKAEIEFVNKSNSSKITYPYENINAYENLTALNIKTWEGYEGVLGQKEYVFNCDSDEIGLLSGSYTINVKLKGNSDKLLGLISSSKAVSVSNVVATKLQTNTYSVEKGVVHFSSYGAYANISLNYNFGLMANDSGFWNNTIIYKIVINDGNKDHVIYAVDFSSVQNGLDHNLISINEDVEVGAQTGEYKYIKYNDNLKFNIFQGNLLNLRANKTINYYNVNEILSGVESTLKSKDLDLTKGGNFKVQIFMLGDDQKEEALVDNSQYAGFLTSSTPDIQEFSRHKTSSVTVSNGVVVFDRQDAPVYRFEFSHLGMGTDAKLRKYIYYLYSGLEKDAQTIAAIYDSGVEENVIQEYNELIYSEELKKYIFDLSELFDGGVFNINLTVLADIGEDDHYMLNSTTSRTMPIFKPSDCDVKVENGEIVFNQAYIIKDGEKEYLDDVSYEITLDGEIVDEENTSIRIDTINHKVKYLTNADSGSVRVRVVSAPESSNLLYGTYAKIEDSYKELNFVRANTVENIEVVDGKLQWKANGAKSFRVIISFKDQYNDDKSILIENGINVNNGIASLTILDSRYQLQNEPIGISFVVIDSFGEGYIDYDVEIIALGNNLDTLNSHSSIKRDINRLASVDKNSIIASEDGILTWAEVENAVRYQIVIKDSEDSLYEYTSETASLDLSKENLAAGSYNVSIRAIGSDKITAINSASTRTFIQLAAVESAEITPSKMGDTANSGVIKWNSVENCDTYLVQVVTNGEIVYERKITDGKTEMLIPQIEGDFEIRIVALSNNDNTAFKSQIFTFTASTATPPSVENARFVAEELRFVIEVEGLTDSDILQLGFHVNGELNEINLNKKEFISSEGVYKFKPLAMGEYTNITVKVVRGNASSDQKLIPDFALDKFTQGNGSEENPFIITNSTQLLNIKDYDGKDVYFKLGNNIVMSNMYNYIVENGVIVEEFKGKLDGDGFEIGLFNYDEAGQTDTITLENNVAFAIFGKLTNATVKNLVIGKSETLLHITNTFEDVETQYAGMSFGLLALNSEGSQISGVTVSNAKLTISGKANFKEDINIAGLIANSTGDLITNCNSKFEVIWQVDMKCDGKTNVSGLVSNAQNTEISGEEGAGTIKCTSCVEFKLVVTNTESSYKLKNVAGVVAYANNLELDCVSVEVEIIKTPCMNFGGVAAYLGGNSVITNAEIKGVFGSESPSNKYIIKLDGVCYGEVYGSSSVSGNVIVDGVEHGIQFNIDYRGNNGKVPN